MKRLADKEVLKTLISNLMVAPDGQIERCNHFHSCSSCLLRSSDCSCEEAFAAWYSEKQNAAIDSKIINAGLIDFAIDKTTNKVVRCGSIDCADCLFDGNDDCITAREEWLKEE